MNLSIPIIAMTASALKGEKAKCLEMGMNDYLSKPFDFSFIYQRISLLLDDAPLDAIIEITEKPDIENLFDLSLLHEMDDNEYVSEILTIFLNNTPKELNELKEACISNKFDACYQTAHKLKSGAGLLQAKPLLNILIKIEEIARAGKSEGLQILTEQAREEYKKVEIKLKEHLRDIQKTLHINALNISRNN
jgi:CheY-like chemotaxis protein